MTMIVMLNNKIVIAVFYYFYLLDVTELTKPWIGLTENQYKSVGWCDGTG